MVNNYYDIEKSFKQKCSRCGKYKTDIDGRYGHKLCGICSKLKYINKVNQIHIPISIIKRYGFKNIALFLEERDDGLLIRKATEEEVLI